ncbi:MAG: SMP-30/gluconolactonase/LRE family protein [Acidobacteria bacterium]|nr:SMP-30/gluconolactonase/LRE family protein [Acidobacteriota bacterium]
MQETRLEAREERFWKCVDREARLSTVVSGLQGVAGLVHSRIGYLLYTADGRMVQREDGRDAPYRVQVERAAAITFDHQGRVLCCTRNAVVRVEKNGSVSMMADGLKAAGDVVYAIDGSIYSTDAAGGRVLRITRERGGVGGKPPQGAVKVAAEDCAWPVGVALSPNQQRLYVTDATKKAIRAYDIAADGSLANSREFAKVDGRGIKTDESGNVWVATEDGVLALDSGGVTLGLVRLRAPVALNWGGGFRGLYIATRNAIYQLPTKSSGTRTY